MICYTGADPAKLDVTRNMNDEEFAIWQENKNQMYAKACRRLAIAKQVTNNMVPAGKMMISNNGWAGYYENDEDETTFVKLFQTDDIQYGIYWKDISTFRWEECDNQLIIEAIKLSAVELLELNYYTDVYIRIPQILYNIIAFAVNITNPFILYAAEFKKEILYVGFISKDEEFNEKLEQAIIESNITDEEAVRIGLNLYIDNID